MTERQPRGHQYHSSGSREVKPCHQLLEFRKVLSTACTTSTSLPPSNERFGQGDRKVSRRDFHCTHMLTGMGCWSTRLMMGTEGVRRLESMGVTEGTKGLRIVTLRLARQPLERGNSGDEGRGSLLGCRQ